MNYMGKEINGNFEFVCAPVNGEINEFTIFANAKFNEDGTVEVDRYQRYGEMQVSPTTLSHDAFFQNYEETTDKTEMVKLISKFHYVEKAETLSSDYDVKDLNSLTVFCDVSPVDDDKVCVKRYSGWGRVEMPDLVITDEQFETGYVHNKNYDIRVAMQEKFAYVQKEDSDRVTALTVFANVVGETENGEIVLDRYRNYGDEHLPLATTAQKSFTENYKKTEDLLAKNDDKEKVKAHSSISRG